MRVLLLIFAAAALTAPASAQHVKNSRSPALKRLTDCRSITGQMERLACFDREAAAIDAAEARQDLVVVDREQLSKARRTLFGLTVPNLSVFGDDSLGKEGVSQIESKVKKATQTPDGKWILELEDGARWVQTDSRELPIDPRPGHTIKIRKGALNSYLANIHAQTAIGMKRSN